MCLAVPGHVESIRDDNGTRMGRVNFGGVVKDVCLAYLPDIAVGDYTIVHVGFAIAKIDEASARETLRTFEELGILEEGLAELRESTPPEANGKTQLPTPPQATGLAPGASCVRSHQAAERKPSPHQAVGRK